MSLKRTVSAAEMREDFEMAYRDYMARRREHFSCAMDSGLEIDYYEDRAASRGDAAHKYFRKERKELEEEMKRLLVWQDKVRAAEKEEAEHIKLALEASRRRIEEAGKTRIPGHGVADGQTMEWTGETEVPLAITNEYMCDWLEGAYKECFAHISKWQGARNDLVDNSYEAVQVRAQLRTELHIISKQLNRLAQLSSTLLADENYELYCSTTTRAEMAEQRAHPMAATISKGVVTEKQT